MSQTISAVSPFPTGTSPIRTKTGCAGLRVLLGFVILYAAIWITRAIMGGGPNLLMRWLGATPNSRAYLGSTLNYGVGIAVYIVFPALALRQVLGVDPWSVFFPLHRGWWKDLLFGSLLITTVLALFFALEVAAGWLVVEAWAWKTLAREAWLCTAWVGFLVNVGVAIGEETVFPVIS